jgi:hypothetical protein
MIISTSPIIFHFINPNKLEKDKIKILKIKKYGETDTFEMLIQSLLKKYKNLYSSEKKLYVGDFTLLYEGIQLKMNVSLDKVNFLDGEPLILLLNKFNKGTISLQTALNVMNVLFPTQTGEISNLSSFLNTQNSNDININTNINTNTNTNINTRSNTNSNLNTNLIPNFLPPAPPPLQIDVDKNVQILIDMGFNESIARTAIKNTGSLQEAINLLIGDP